jgi:hypothetical protein
MAIGISGDTQFPTAGGVTDESLILIELRTISNLLQSPTTGTNQGQGDELRVLRNDQATELGLPTPVPGN